MNFSAFMMAFVPLCLLVLVYIIWLEWPVLAEQLFAQLFSRVAVVRPPDFVIGTDDSPYLQRWWLLPRNRFFNAYLHCFLRDDDDRALHDHPWWSLSLILKGSYIEHTIHAGGMHSRERLETGRWRLRSAKHAHRIELEDAIAMRDGRVYLKGKERCWTLFLTGPVIRNWGFHCPDRGWVNWERFTDPADKGRTGPGCDA